MGSYKYIVATAYLRDFDAQAMGEENYQVVMLFEPETSEGVIGAALLERMIEERIKYCPHLRPLTPHDLGFHDDSQICWTTHTVQSYNGDK